MFPEHRLVWRPLSHCLSHCGLSDLTHSISVLVMIILADFTAYMFSWVSLFLSHLGYLPAIQNTIRQHLAKWVTKETILGQQESRFLATDVTARCILGYEYSQREIYLLTQSMDTIEKGFFSLPYNIPGSPLCKVSCCYMFWVNILAIDPVWSSCLQSFLLACQMLAAWDANTLWCKIFDPRWFRLPNIASQNNGFNLLHLLVYMVHLRGIVLHCFVSFNEWTTPSYMSYFTCSLMIRV